MQGSQDKSCLMVFCGTCLLSLFPFPFSESVATPDDRCAHRITMPGLLNPFKAILASVKSRKKVEATQHSTPVLSLDNEADQPVRLEISSESETDDRCCLHSWLL